MANNLTHLILIAILYSRSKFWSHLTDEETAADTGGNSSKIPEATIMVEPGFAAMSSGPNPRLLTGLCWPDTPRDNSTTVKCTDLRDSVQ